MSRDGDDLVPSGGELLLYQTEDGRTRIQCRFEDGTLWLTQAQMAELFQTTPQNVTMHLRAIFAEGELVEEATCKEYLQVRQEGQREVKRSLRHYNLAAILAVGFRVRSHRGTQFRQWAIERLDEYLVKGFTMDDERLKRPPSRRPSWSTGASPRRGRRFPRRWRRTSRRRCRRPSRSRPGGPLGATRRAGPGARGARSHEPVHRVRRRRRGPGRARGGRST